MNCFGPDGTVSTKATWPLSVLQLTAECVNGLHSGRLVVWVGIVDLELVSRAAYAAHREDVEDASHAALEAASAMPIESSDFDRGMAAGMAVALFLIRSDPADSSRLSSEDGMKLAK
jgi:hypothetical protein